MTKKSKNSHYSKNKSSHPSFVKEGNPRNGGGGRFRIALVTDYIKEFGGAESVLEYLSDIFPSAPIYTSLYFPQYLGPHRSRLEKKWQGRIHTSFFQNIPFVAKLISVLRLLSPLAFKSFNFSGYDLILTSATGAYFPNSLNKKSAKLFCYCHTPPRYLYGLPTARNYSKNPILRPLIELMNYFLRIADKNYSINVDQYLTNSQTTATRIKKFYNRTALIINPPVSISCSPLLARHSLGVGGSKGRCPPRREGDLDFYLTGGRLARAKRYDIAILACNQLGLKLKVFGRDFANHLSELKALACPNIEFLGEITNEEKSKLLHSAKGFIFCSDHEDFGIAPVEAMAVGCPVVAYASGGVTETIIDGKTGILFDKLDVASCISAIQKLENANIKPTNCISQAQKFSPEVFIQKIKNTVSLRTRNGG